MAKLTKSIIDALPIPDPKPNGTATQSFVRDDTLPGFGLRVGSGGTKTFFVERRVNGKVKRITIGRYGHLTPIQARTRAQELLGEIASGKDPHAEKIAKRAQTITLNDAFEDYLVSRKDLKPGTITNYRKCLNGYVKDWLPKRLTDITKDMIEKRHREIGQRTHAKANNTMRVLRAIFNHAMAKFEDSQCRPILLSNPVDRLNQARAWYTIERRTTWIKPSQLKDWYDATQQLNSETTRDFLVFLLFTGLRKSEATNLRWENVDFNEKTFTITDTKNGDPHTLPLSDFLFEFLKRREVETEGRPWVFPSPVESGPLKEPRSALKRVEELYGKPFTLHDLRRTFITIAESLDIPAYALKRLINHRDPNDVTAGYIIANVERLRDPMGKISLYLQEHTKNIQPLRNRHCNKRD